MEIQVIGDAHGNPDFIPEKGLDLTIAVGDLYGDPEPLRQARFQSINSGKDWWEIAENPEKLVDRSLEKGRKILEKLQSLDAPVIVVLGNWDWTDTRWSYLEGKGLRADAAKHRSITVLNDETTEAEGLKIGGVGDNSAPEDDPGLEERLQGLDFTGIDVLVSHNAPHGTLDRVDNPESPKHGEHMGSRVTSRIIERENPDYCFCGHIHDAEGLKELGNNTVLNTGLENSYKVKYGGRPEKL